LTFFVVVVIAGLLVLAVLTGGVVSRAACLEVSDKSERVFRFQQGTVKQAQQVIGSMGLRGPSEIEPWMWSAASTRRPLAPAQTSVSRWSLVSCSPRRGSWVADWGRANPDSFKARSTRSGESHADRR
jgi:hypothetical protein